MTLMNKKVLSLTQSLLGASIPVLCYHQVRPDSGMTPEKFGSHLDLIRRMGFETIGLRKNYYPAVGGGREHAEVMCLRLKDDRP